MNVLVTGGAGYIGSQTAKHLAAAGHHPVVLDNLSRGHASSVRWGPFVKGDIADQKLVAEAIHQYQITAVIHFAAYAYVGESMSDPGIYFENNAAKSARLIRTAHDAGVKHFIFSSTCATYGEPQVVPMNEDHPQRPVNPYGESKLFVEKVLRWYGEVYELTWVALRYFNAAGADPQTEIGECHNPETHLIPLVIEAALTPNYSVKIFGTDYPTPDGTAIRDYIHVADLADAHVAALHYLVSGGKSLAINLGTGQGHSVNEVIAAVAQVTGKQPVAIKEARRKGDPSALIADPTLAHQTLNWKASHSGLTNIVRTAYLWRRTWPILRSPRGTCKSRRG